VRARARRDNRAAAHADAAQLPGPFKWRLLVKALQLAGPACLDGLEDARDAILFSASVVKPALLRVVTAWVEGGDGDSEGDGDGDEDSDGEEADEATAAAAPGDDDDGDDDAEFVAAQAIAASFAADGVDGHTPGFEVGTGGSSSSSVELPTAAMLSGGAAGYVGHDDDDDVVVSAAPAAAVRGAMGWPAVAAGSAAVVSRGAPSPTAGWSPGSDGDGDGEGGDSGALGYR